jgi:hypothetical protein
MAKILVAFDGPSGLSVVHTAVALGELFAADIATVDSSAARPDDRRASRARSDLQALRVRTSRLMTAIASPDVVAAVVAGTAGEGLPEDPAARHAMRYALKPIVVVPPRACIDGSRGIGRLLAPLDAQLMSSVPLRCFLTSCIHSDVEILPLHVFTDATVPTMMDRPYYDLADLEREFLRRWLPGRDAVVRWERGAPESHVVESCRPPICDAVVLAWSQELEGDRARVVRAVLARSEVPVILLSTALAALDLNAVAVVDLRQTESESGTPEHSQLQSNDVSTVRAADGGAALSTTARSTGS